MLPTRRHQGPSQQDVPTKRNDADRLHPKFIAMYRMLAHSAVMKKIAQEQRGGATVERLHRLERAAEMLRSMSPQNMLTAISAHAWRQTESAARFIEAPDEKALRAAPHGDNRPAAFIEADAAFKKADE